VKLLFERSFIKKGCTKKSRKASAKKIIPQENLHEKTKRGMFLKRILLLKT